MLSAIDIRSLESSAMTGSKRVMWAPSVPNSGTLRHAPTENLPLQLSTNKREGVLHPAAIVPKKEAFPFKVVLEHSPPPSASVGYVMSFNSPSFFALGFGIMLLGVCFFLSGLLLGAWMTKPVHHGHYSQESAIRAPSQTPRPSGKKGAFFSENTLKDVTGATALASQIAGGSKLGRVVMTAHRAGQNAQMISDYNKERAERHGMMPGETPNESMVRESSTAMTSSHGTPRNPSPPISNQKYVVQLGSFIKKSNARDLVQKLAARSLHASIIEEKDASGEPVFHVRIGQYSNFSEAAEWASVMSQQLTISAIVVSETHKDK